MFRYNYITTTLIISSFGKMLLILMVIWDYTGLEYSWHLVNLIVLTSNIEALSGKRSVIRSWEAERRRRKRGRGRRGDPGIRVSMPWPHPDYVVVVVFLLSLLRYRILVYWVYHRLWYHVQDSNAGCIHWHYRGLCFGDHDQHVDHLFCIFFPRRIQNNLPPF